MQTIEKQFELYSDTIPKDLIESTSPLYSIHPKLHWKLLDWSKDIGAVLYGGMAAHLLLKKKYGRGFYDDNKAPDVDCYLPIEWIPKLEKSLKKFLGPLGKELTIYRKEGDPLVHPLINGIGIIDIKVLPMHIFKGLSIEVVDGHKVISFADQVSSYMGIIFNRTVELDNNRLDKDLNKLFKSIDILSAAEDLPMRKFVEKLPPMDLPFDINQIGNAYLAGRRALDRITGQESPKDTPIELAVTGDPNHTAKYFEKYGYYDYEVLIHVEWDRILPRLRLYGDGPNIDLIDCSTSGIGVIDRQVCAFNIGAFSPDVALETLGAIARATPREYYMLVGEKMINQQIAHAIFRSLVKETGLDRYEYQSNIEFLRAATKTLLSRNA